MPLRIVPVFSAGTHRHYTERDHCCNGIPVYLARVVGVALFAEHACIPYWSKFLT